MMQSCAERVSRLDDLRKAARACALLAMTGLAACTGTFPNSIARAVIPAPTKMQVAKGAVTIAGPNGYCVDTETSRDTDEGAFVLMGSCASISQSFFGLKPKKPAVLTAAVAPGHQDKAEFVASFPATAKFLGSKAGRAALSRTGKANTVRILQITSMDDVMFIHATDSAAEQTREVDPEYWRALTTVNGKIVTLTVLGVQGMPLESDAKRTLLDEFVLRVRSLSAQQ